MAEKLIKQVKVDATNTFDIEAKYAQYANTTATTLSNNQLRNITISSELPSSSDGSVGDIWLRYEDVGESVELNNN